MKIKINSTEQLGAVARVVRKNQGLTQEIFAATAGFGERFVREVEKGKSTAEVGRVLRQLSELGITVWLDLPASIDQEALLMQLSQKSEGMSLTIEDHPFD